MGDIIFSINNYDINTGTALLGIGTAILVALIIIGIVLLRSDNTRTEMAAKTATENVRTNFTQQISDREARLEKQDIELTLLRQDNTALEARAAALQAQMGEQQKHNAHVQEQMGGQFKLLAGDVLKSHGETFSKQNREQVDALLKPLSDKISEFQKQSHAGAAQLAEQMKTLTAYSLRMSEEATNLTRALKGNSQTQGAWGEMILANILEKSGLVEGEQFLTQQSHSGDGGARVRTDVEVMFPNGDRMVVDSKVSLVAFEALCNCESEEERKRFSRDHITSIKAHIKTLGSKDYQVHAQSGLDYVMMFIPIEAAFSTAFSDDNSLVDYAIKQNVYITTPTTLMVALRTVRNVWDIEARNQNAEEIGKRAGALFDKVSGFLTSMDKLDKSLFTAQKNFDDAKNQLTSGRGSVVRQVELLQKLGAKNSKQIPAGWEEGGNPPAIETSENDEIVPAFLPSSLLPPDQK